MGLDGMELVFAVENRFGIQLPLQRFRHLRTVGDFFQLLLEQLADRPLSEHDSIVRTFARVRATLQEIGLDVQLLRLPTRLADLFPVESRRERWNEFFARLGYAGPRLVFHPRIVRATGGGMLIGFAGVFWFAYYQSWPIVALFLFLVNLMLPTLVSYGLRRFAVEFPNYLVTVENLIQWIITYHPYQPDTRPPTAEVWLIVQGMFADFYQVSIETITPETPLWW